MKKHLHKIAWVEPGSIAEELGLEPGDAIEEINGNEIEDIFDYQYYVEDEYLDVLILTKDGEECVLEIEKDEDEDLGITFESSLMDEYHSCCNKCMFCFIDQMPPGMRETLYFKDDDSRLSFLQGNYVTLTNMSEKDIERVIRYHLEPINISFQAMNPELRCKMLHNRFAGKALDKVDMLYNAGITMNGQIVLCKGVNDGDELEYSLEKLSAYAPVLQSVSVVPVGLTKYRKGLYPLEPFNKEDAEKVLGQIERWQKIMMEKYGIHFIHASDEWYILADRELPCEDEYDGYLQLENGVGMLRLLETEVKETLEGLSGDDRKVTGRIATGKLAAPFIARYIKEIQKKYPNVQISVTTIENRFFGEKITVSGLITGQDLKEQLSGLDLGEKLLIPCSMLKGDEEIFLDDMTLEELSEALNTEIVIVDTGGRDLVEAVINPPEHKQTRRRQIYEQTSSSDSGKA